MSLLIIQSRSHVSYSFHSYFQHIVVAAIIYSYPNKFRDINNTEAMKLNEKYIEYLEKNENLLKLNARHKHFIRHCAEDQLRDDNFMRMKLSELSFDDPDIVKLENDLEACFTKEQSVPLIRGLLIKTGTDVVLNDNDKYGDGDQSFLIGKHLKDERQAYGQKLAT